MLYNTPPLGRVFGLYSSYVSSQSFICRSENVLETTLQLKSESEVKSLSRVPTLCDPMDCSLPGSSVHGIFQARVLVVGCHFFLQWTFPTQGSDLGLPHCRQTLYRLSHQGSPLLSDIDLQIFFPTCGLSFHFFFFSKPQGLWDLSSPTRD